MGGVPNDEVCLWPRTCIFEVRMSTCGFWVELYVLLLGVLTGLRRASEIVYDISVELWSERGRFGYVFEVPVTSSL